MPKELLHIYLPANSVQMFHLACILIYKMVFVFLFRDVFNSGYLIGWERISRAFHKLNVILYRFCHVLNFFVHFTKSVCYLVLGNENSHYSWDINPLFDIWLSCFSSKSVGCLFTLSHVSFAIQGKKKWCCQICVFLFLFALPLASYSGNHGQLCHDLVLLYSVYMISCVIFKLWLIVVIC